VEHRAKPRRVFPSRRQGEGDAAFLDALLALLIRRVMVASGTRNARAISFVVKPATARKVRAIWDAGDSAG
jgi:hypothetical protein